MNKIYIVECCMGIDGSYIVAVFSKKEDADKLCELYEKTESYGDYDFCIVSEQIVDDKKIENYYVDDSQGWAQLEYKVD